MRRVPERSFIGTSLSASTGYTSLVDGDRSGPLVTGSANITSNSGYGPSSGSVRGSGSGKVTFVDWSTGMTIAPWGYGQASHQSQKHKGSQEKETPIFYLPFF